MKQHRRDKKKQKISILVLLSLLLIIAAWSIWYINDYYHSQDVEEYLTDSESVVVQDIKDGYFFDGKGKDAAFIFYPGAKVEATAYAPLLYQLAEQGVDCFLVEMPGKLAIFGQNRADKIMEKYNYKYWYMAGHSLGGAMAASYASNHLDVLDGLILLAAYPTKDLKADNFLVLSLYGSNDQVINREKLESGREFMPGNYEEISIEGGNHAGFGQYGQQAGDGKAAISGEEQRKQTIGLILDKLHQEME